jgi:hypothetical protein
MTNYITNIINNKGIKQMACAIMCCVMIFLSSGCDTVSSQFFPSEKQSSNEIPPQSTEDLTAYSSFNLNEDVHYSSAGKESIMTMSLYSTSANLTVNVSPNMTEGCSDINIDASSSYLLNFSDAYNYVYLYLWRYTNGQGWQAVNTFYSPYFEYYARYYPWGEDAQRNDNTPLLFPLNNFQTQIVDHCVPNGTHYYALKVWSYFNSQWNDEGHYMYNNWKSRYLLSDAITVSSNNNLEILDSNFNVIPSTVIETIGHRVTYNTINPVNWRVFPYSFGYHSSGSIIENIVSSDRQIAFDIVASGNIDLTAILKSDYRVTDNIHISIPH